MAMYPCPKCHKTNWDYKKIDNDPLIYCACKSCGHKLSFRIPKKSCMYCGQPTDFERLIIDDYTRGKKCLLCGKVKLMERARAEFKVVDGKDYRLEDDELWHEVEVNEVKVKGGYAMHIATNQNVCFTT